MKKMVKKAPSKSKPATSHKKDSASEVSLSLDKLTRYLPRAVFAKSARPETFGQFIYWNRRAEALIGIRAEDIIGKTDFDLFPKEQAEFFHQKDLECFKTSRVLEVKEEPVHLDIIGTKWLQTVKVPIRDDNGKPLCILCLTDDITEKKNREGNLGFDDFTLKEIADHPSIGIAVLTTAGQHKEVNAAYAKLFRLTKDSLPERNLPTLLHEDSLEEFKKASKKISDGWPEVTVKLKGKRSDNTSFWVQASLTPSKKENGKPNLLGIFTDITEQVEARLSAENSNKAKGTFLASMSHELRVPLNTIIAPAEMLMENLEEDERKEYVDMIHHSAQDLLALVNDFLDYSKIESGSLPLKNVEFNLPSLLENIIRSFDLAARNKNIELRRDISTSVPSRITTDPIRLMQILNNLLDNAVKFTDRGYVEFHVTMESPGNGVAPVIFFRVKDTGTGIPPEAHRKLFLPFVQADTTVSQKYGGSGLGLAICKNLCEIMGGGISYKSQRGVGSTFEFWIPVKPKSAKKTSAKRTHFSYRTSNG